MRDDDLNGVLGGGGASGGSAGGGGGKSDGGDGVGAPGGEVSVAEEVVSSHLGAHSCSRREGEVANRVGEGEEGHEAVALGEDRVEGGVAVGGERFSAGGGLPHEGVGGDGGVVGVGVEGEGGVDESANEGEGGCGHGGGGLCCEEDQLL